MKKIKLLLIILNLIIIVLIIIKLLNQTTITNYELESGLDEKSLRYELQREILYGEKSLYSEFDSDGKRVNTSEKMKKEQKLDDGLTVKDYNISYKNNFSQITATVYNSSNEVKGGYPANLVLLNDKNEEILSLKVNINKVQPKAETKIATGITADIADVYKCEIQILEEENDE